LNRVSVLSSLDSGIEHAGMTKKLKAPVIPAKAGIQVLEIAIVFMPTCTKQMPGQAYQLRHDGLVSSALKLLISIN